MIVIHQRWTEAPLATGLSGQVVEAVCIVPEGAYFTLYSAYYDPNKGQTLHDAHWHNRGHTGHMPGMLTSALNLISQWPGAHDLVTYGQRIMEACDAAYKACKGADANLPSHIQQAQHTPFSQ